MGFGRALRKLRKNLNIQGVEKYTAAVTTGGLSLLAHPRVQAQIGTGILSFAATAGAGALGVGAGVAPTSRATAARQQQRGPQAARGYSPSAYAQRLGRQRYARRGRG